MGLPFRIALLSGARPFTPLSLFAAGEVGAWYDPSDLTSMFQDSAGTTAAALEAPVGLMLDKSKGLAVGAELVTNGDFSSGATGWAAINAGILSVNSGVITVTNNVTAFGGFSQAITTVSGKTYCLQLQYTKGTASGCAINIGTTAGGGTLGQAIATVSGSVTYYFRASGTTTYISPLNNSSTNGVTSSFDNISVKEIAGNHASQSTSASRPVLSARVNQLTFSEQFDNAAWTKLNILAFGSGSVANAITAPNGTDTADFIVPNTTTAQHGVYQSASAVSGVTYTHSVYAKAGGYNWLYMTEGNNVTAQASFNLSSGVLGAVEGTGSPSATITAVGNGWFRCTLTLTPISTIQNFQARAASGNGGLAYAGDGTSGIYVWGADVRATNDGVGLPVYQRIAAATDYDSGSEWPRFLRFDGVDDSLATAAIDFSATDKMSVFAGVRKLSDASSGCIVELSATSDATNNGSFGLFAPYGIAANFGYSSRGTVTRNAAAVTFTSPTTAVLTGASSISEDICSIRVNAAAGATQGSDQGTGNYGSAYPLYIGRRGGTTFPANMRLYQLIVRGAASTATEITNAETYTNGKTKAY